MRSILILCSFLACSAALNANILDDVSLIQLKDGKEFPYQIKKETTHIALYFSASWCAPCRKTTPPLAEEYKRMQSQDQMPVEIIFIGNDNTQDAKQAYMKQYEMPWPTVVWSDQSLLEKYTPKSIPALVLIELSTGKVVALGEGIDGVENVVSQIRGITQIQGEFQVRSWLDKYAILMIIPICVFFIFLLNKKRHRKNYSDKPS